jgi:hypothetical protein
MLRIFYLSSLKITRDRSLFPDGFNLSIHRKVQQALRIEVFYVSAKYSEAVDLPSEYAAWPAEAYIEFFEMVREGCLHTRTILAN